MFLDFFYTLRAKSVPVSTGEYLDFLKVIEASSVDKAINPEQFFNLSRSTLVKDIKFYDSFELAFSECFGNIIQSDDDFRKKLEEWLKKAVEHELSEQRKKDALNILPEDLIEELQKRLEEQKERHDTGNKWVGTGGTSPFGNSGYNPSGIRVGGAGRNKSALAVVGKREYKQYRSDQTLNIRQIKVALKKLRLLKQKGREELNIDKTITKTCENAGDIDLVFTKKRKNNLKVILLMDVGGSMTPHSERVEKLFSAAHQINHFKEFKHFYFHNIFYDDIYKTASMWYDEQYALKDLYKKYDKETRFIIVGDAYMAPYELFQMNGSIREYYQSFNQANDKSNMTALNRLEEFKRKYPKTVWLNPEKKYLWNEPTIKAIKSIFPMHHLSLEGLDSAIRDLL